LRCCFCIAFSFAFLHCIEFCVFALHGLLRFCIASIVALFTLLFLYLSSITFFKFVHMPFFVIWILIALHVLPK
jgi:hypothetical protein